jgi:hypothetical protein
VNTQSTLAGGGNALTITGAADIDGAYTGLASLSITGAANLGGDVTTTGTQTYQGIVTLGSDVLLSTSNANVTFNGVVDSGSGLTKALDIRAGDGVVQFDRSVGFSAPLARLTTAAAGSVLGTTMLGSHFGSVTTVDDQVYNNITMADDLNMRQVRDVGSAGVTVTTETGGSDVVYPVRFKSIAGNLNFLGTVDGGAYAKTNMRSLQLQAAGQISFNGTVGFDPALNNSNAVLDNYTRHYGIYRFEVTAPVINALADVAAYEEVTFNGRTYIGGTGLNGTYRRIYSIDPKITFNGTVDGYGGTDGVYTLDARALSLDSRLPDPEIDFGADVGASRALAGVMATVARLDLVRFDRLSNGNAPSRSQADFDMPSAANAGTIRFAGNVVTTGQQSYLANRFVIDTSSRNNALEFNAASGDVDFTVGQGRMVSATGGAPRVRFGNRPSSATINALRSSGAVITSEPNDLSELVNLQETHKLSSAKVMEQDLDQRAGQTPTVEVGDLLPVNCDSVDEERCMPEKRKAE